jgi:putative ABC transport system permease protein
LVWAGIWRKRGRAILTLLSVVNAFLLFGLLQGLAGGLNNTVANAHADILLTASRISQIEPLPMAHLAQIKAVPGVRAVTPMVLFHGTYRLPNQFIQAFGVDPDQWVATDTDSKIPKAQIETLKRTRSGALLSSTFARAYRIKVGDRIPLKSMFWTYRDGTNTWPVDIVGIYPANSADTIFGNAMLVNYDYADQGRTSSNGTSSVFLVRVVDPTKAGDVAAAIDKLFANSPHETKTESVQQLLQDSIKQIGDVGLVVRYIIGAVFFALLFSVGAVMMQSMRERTSELAVLKTLGFSDGGVLRLILAETLLFCLISAGLGLGLAALLFPVIRKYIGFDIHAGPVMAVGFLLAAALALISGLPPAVRAMRLQIVDALAGR